MFLRLVAALLAILAPLTLLIVHDSLCRRQAFELSRTWLYGLKRSPSPRPEKLFAELASLAHASGFLRQVAFLDASLAVKRQFAFDVGNLPKQVAEKGIVVDRVGVLGYRSVFSVPSSELGVVVLVFSDDRGLVQLVVFCIFLLIAFGGATTSLLIISRNNLQSTFRDYEIKAHDFLQTLGKVNRVLLALKNVEVAEALRLTPTALLSLKRSENIAQEMLMLGSRDIYDRRVLDMGEVLCEVIKCCELRVKPQVSIEHRGEICGSEAKIYSIVRNLLENANAICHHKISLETFDRDKFFTLKITNDGKGLNRKDLARVFNPFFSRRRGGSGLGLYSTKKFVELHGGTIAMSSSAELTTVTVNLPIHIGMSAANAKMDLNVAVVDNEVEEITTLLGDLSPCRCTHLLSPSELEAHLLANEHFDVIVIDRFMPNFDAVRDNYLRVLRNDFNFSGAVILRSHAVPRREAANGFDLCVPKESKITSADLISCLRSECC